jgi:O-methyltransferase
MEFNYRDIHFNILTDLITGAAWKDVSISFPTVGIYDEERRFGGGDYPETAFTMIGINKINHLRKLCEDVIENKIPGDFIETGVWRGGSCIFMNAILKYYSIKDKTVWVADSFEGLPKPNAEKYPKDAGDVHHELSDHLAISLDSVKENFKKFDLLNEQVKFLKGFFSETLPTAPIEKLSILRLDGDMYESTMDGLVNLYPKLSVGGYIIIDDWGLQACKDAINDYRAEHNITEEIQYDPLRPWPDYAFWKKIN